MSKRKWNVMKNSTRRGYMSLPMQIQSRLYHFKSHILGLVAAQVFSVVMVARLFGISRNTFYKYRHQAEQGSLASFDCTPRVHGPPNLNTSLMPCYVPRHNTRTSASSDWQTSSTPKAFASPRIPCSVSCARMLHLCHRSNIRDAIGTPLKRWRLTSFGRWIFVISTPTSTTALIAI